MVRVQRSSPKNTLRNPSLLLRWCILVFVVVASMLSVWNSVRSTVVVPAQVRGPPLLLSTPNNTQISTSVRGNLGPAQVMLQEGTNWLKDRWQAASDMHGTAIQGSHHVWLSFHVPVQVNSVVLDWEAAFSQDYLIEGRLVEMDAWFVLHDSTSRGKSVREVRHSLLVLASTKQTGQSPGVKSKTPLHVIHTLVMNHTTTKTTTASTVEALPMSPPLQELRLTIRSSAMGWGVSLWQVKVFGWPLSLHES